MVSDEEGEEGDGGVQADVDDDGGGLAVKHHELPWCLSEVLQDLEGQRHQQEDVGQKQVDQVDANALLLLRHNMDGEVAQVVEGSSMTLKVGGSNLSCSY